MGSNRIVGVDIARGIAIFGMVFINYDVIVGSSYNGPRWLQVIYHNFQGRFASLFVMIAGIGFGYMYSSRSNRNESEKSSYLTKFDRVILRRSLFLLVIGLIHTSLWRSDILHFYTFYFLIGLLLIRFSPVALTTLILILPFSFVGLYYIYSYDVGWQFSYIIWKIWSPLDILTRVFYDGYYPVIPWQTFFIVGFLLSKVNLKSTKNLVKMIVIGVILLMIPWLLSNLEIKQIDTYFGSSSYPYPPFPLFMFSTIGSSLLILSISLIISFQLDFISSIMQRFGRMALSIYLIHAYPFLVLVDKLYWFNRDLIFTSIAAILFNLIAIFGSYVWLQKFSYGPFEGLMRNISEID